MGPAGADPRRAAASVRERLDIGRISPVADSIATVEGQLGIPVSVLDLGTDLAGAYVIRRERPFILVNGLDYKYRRRFTLAHELGHHELGHAAVVDPTSVVGAQEAVDPREREANLFAGEFLAPRAAIEALLEDMGNPPPTINATVHIADNFGISVPAAFVRLCQEGVIRDRAAQDRIKAALDRGDHRNAAQQLGIKGFEDSLTLLSANDLPRLPAALRENALHAYEAGLLSVHRLAEILSRPVEEVRRLLAELGISREGDDPDAETG